MKLKRFLSISLPIGPVIQPSVLLESLINYPTQFFSITLFSYKSHGYIQYLWKHTALNPVHISFIIFWSFHISYYKTMEKKQQIYVVASTFWSICSGPYKSFSSTSPALSHRPTPFCASFIILTHSFCMQSYFHLDVAIWGSLVVYKAITFFIMLGCKPQPGGISLSLVPARLGWQISFY